MLAEDGVRLARQGRLREAMVQLRAALDADPNHFDALQNLGVVALQSRVPDEALHYLNMARELRPDVPETHNNLAIACMALGRNADAIAHYDSLLALRPDDRNALQRLIQLLFAELRPLEALQAAERVARERPDLGYAHGMHAAVLRTFGRVKEALAAAERAIAAEPANAQHYYLLAQLKRFAHGDLHLAAMLALSREPGLVRQDRAALLFALAKAHRDLGEEEQSFDFLDQANAAVRTNLRYDEGRELALLARIKETFTPELFRAKAGAGDPSPAPIFILGMPRSGTTLVEQILSSHPRVAAAGEIGVGPQVVQRLLPDFPRGVEMPAPDELRSAGRDYLAGIGKLLATADRVTDKSLTNVMFAGFLHLALPNAKFIHVTRDPVDTCLSCYSLNFGDGLGFTYDLAELGRYYRAHEDLAAHWQRVLPPGSIITVRHEDIVADPEREARRMIAHVGLEWDAACLTPEKSARPVFTASAAQVRERVSFSSSGYRRVSPDRLAPLIDGLGDLARRRA